MRLQLCSRCSDSFSWTITASRIVGGMSAGLASPWQPPLHRSPALVPSRWDVMFLWWCESVRSRRCHPAVHQKPRLHLHRIRNRASQVHLHATDKRRALAGCLSPSLPCGGPPRHCKGMQRSGQAKGSCALLLICSNKQHLLSAFPSCRTLDRFSKGDGLNRLAFITFEKKHGSVFHAYVPRRGGGIMCCPLTVYLQRWFISYESLSVLYSIRLKRSYNGSSTNMILENIPPNGTWHQFTSFQQAAVWRPHQMGTNVRRTINPEMN